MPREFQLCGLGNAIVGAKLDENQQLQLVDYFAPPNANWMRARDLDMNVTPMAFDYRGRKFLVGTSKECRLWLLDRDAAREVPASLARAASP